jgi:hypothetical protein
VGGAVCQCCPPLGRSARRERPHPDRRSSPPSRRTTSKRTKEADMPLAARRMRRRAVIGPRRWLEPPPRSVPPPLWPVEWIVVWTVERCGGTGASDGARAVSHVRLSTGAPMRSCARPHGTPVLRGSEANAVGSSPEKSCGSSRPLCPARCRDCHYVPVGTTFLGRTQGRKLKCSVSRCGASTTSLRLCVLLPTDGHHRPGQAPPFGGG